MEYFKILKFKKEPFSNSPDPEFFFESRQHLDCLQQLELSVRLRRGLNVVIGDVGTGKTTLCHQLIRKFDREEKVETYLILDPSFSNPLDFLSNVAGMFLGEPISKEATSMWRLKEKIKHYLFARGVDEGKIVVLIIDEGQKIPLFCLEILREFLNYETNQHKLLQIIIFAQREFTDTIKNLPNFGDRINLCHLLGPLDFRDTRAMIRFRLKRASENSKSSSVFSYLAMWSVYRATQGYPRKIIHLCHRTILELIIQNRSRAGWFLVHSCARRALPGQSRKWQWATATAISCMAAAFLLLNLTPWPSKTRVPRAGKESKTVSTETHEVFPSTQAVTVKISAVPVTVHKATTAATPETVTKASAKALDEDRTGSGPVEPLKALIQETSFPRLLGQITVRGQEETVGDMIIKIYGSFKGGRYLDSVARENPHIRDLDIIEIGDELNFPAVPITPKSSPEKLWWVKIGEEEMLNRAYQYLKSYPKDAPPARIIPYWDRHNGLKFAIVVKKYFMDERFARGVMSSLPATGEKCLTQWKEDTVFFTELPK